MEVKTGRMLLLSHGAYSSYERIGWFVAVQDFDPDEQLRLYLDEHEKEKEHHGFSHTRFMAWVIRKGLLVEIEEFFDEWHMGDYRRASEVFFMPRDAEQADPVAPAAPVKMDDIVLPAPEGMEHADPEMNTKAAIRVGSKLKHADTCECRICEHDRQAAVNRLELGL